jgi:hypothetical protein
LEEDRRRRRIRSSREGATVRFEMPDANDDDGGGGSGSSRDSAATRAGERIGCRRLPSPLTDDERALCYVTKRETKANKRAAAQLAREHALRHREHVRLLQQLFDTPLKCAGAGRGGRGGKDDNDHPKGAADTDSSDQRRLLLPRELSATDVLGWVDKDPEAGGGGGATTTTMTAPTGDGAPMAYASDLLLQRIASSDWARGLEPFVAPLLRRHQRWAIRAVLGRHRQLKAAKAATTTTTTTTRRERGSGGGCSGSSSPRTQQRGRDEYDDERDGPHDEALRRCCEVVNACTRDMARLLAEADARAAQHIYREDSL